MRRYIFRALYAAVVAGIALTTFGFAGGSAQATATASSLSPPRYSDTYGGGYHAWGRWFRFVTTTVTVPPYQMDRLDGGNFLLRLSDSGHADTAQAVIWAMPDRNGVYWQGPGASSGEDFGLSPHVGDQLALSIYYDKWHGYTYFTANDRTQGITKTARVKSGNLTFNSVELTGHAAYFSPSPRADVRLWKVADTHLTTYTGVHGTVIGPWQTGQMILTSDGTAKGAVVLSPSGLWNGGQNFGVWLRHR